MSREDSHSLASQRIAKVQFRPSRVERFAYFWRLYCRNKKGVFGLVIVVLFVVLAVLAPFISPYDPYQRVARPFEPPSWLHPLGADDMGQDLLSTLIYATRVSLLVGLVAALADTIIGTLIGSVAGY